MHALNILTGWIVHEPNRFESDLQLTPSSSQTGSSVWRHTCAIASSGESRIKHDKQVDTVDGRNLAPVDMLNIWLLYRALYIPGGDFFHQQYQTTNSRFNINNLYGKVRNPMNFH